MPQVTDLAELATPSALVDLDRMEANLGRMAAYVQEHGLALRPHTKTHKNPALVVEQLERGALGATVATIDEARAMSAVVSDVLVAYPPVGPARINGLLGLPEDIGLTVSLDSSEALRRLADALSSAGREADILIELDLGMRRCGIRSAESALALAREASELEGVKYRGIMFYPGHIREPVDAQGQALERLTNDLTGYLQRLGDAGLPADVVSGGSTPTAFASHRMPGLTEIRPGTYIFNDRTTAVIGACDWEDCAYSVLATVVSTAVPDQVVIDAGSKALSREELRAPEAIGYGALRDRPEVPVSAISEEHGVLDLSGTEWRPRIGEQVRVIPNHVCVSVNLHSRVWGVRGDRIEREWAVAARR